MPNTFNRAVRMSLIKDNTVLDIYEASFTKKQWERGTLPTGIQQYIVMALRNFKNDGRCIIHLDRVGFDVEPSNSQTL